VAAQPLVGDEWEKRLPFGILTHKNACDLQPNGDGGMICVLMKAKARQTLDALLSIKVSVFYNRLSRLYHLLHLCILTVYLNHTLLANYLQDHVSLVLMHYFELWSGENK